MDNDFLAIANSLKRSMKYLGPWTAGDLSFGLRALTDAHLKREIQDPPEGDVINDKQLIKTWVREVEVADAVYEESTEAISKACSLEPGNVVSFRATSDHLQPAYCLAKSVQHRQILLVVRGTKNFYDALTNLAGAYEAVEGGFAHHGMLKSAEWLLEQEGDRIRSLLDDHPGYGLRLIGHSLGGGTSSLLCWLLHNMPPDVPDWKPHLSSISCIAFACPPVLTSHLARSCTDHTTSIISQHDAVPRTSLASLEELRKEILATKWPDQLRDQVLGKKLGALAQASFASIAEHYDRATRSLNKLLEDPAISSHHKAMTSAVQGAWSRISEEASKGRVVSEQLVKSLQERFARDSKGQLGKPHAESRDLSQLQHRQDMPSLEDPPQLHAPGRIIFLAAASEGKKGSGVQLIKALPRGFDRIILNKSMLSDHLCQSYKEQLQSLLDEQPSEQQ
ncbi:hypothetical protein WJX74_004800 [Apatococcus lobatus]|uniref:Fungal lipase-type domain-containing protein n=1 Tax=Apatococcus lobatus TaxID=904363 RepID=A0AAW1QTW9_9CHLO